MAGLRSCTGRVWGGERGPPPALRPPSPGISPKPPVFPSREEPRPHHTGVIHSGCSTCALPGVQLVRPNGQSPNQAASSHGNQTPPYTSHDTPALLTPETPRLPGSVPRGGRGQVCVSRFASGRCLFLLDIRLPGTLQDRCPVRAVAAAALGAWHRRTEELSEDRVTRLAPPPGARS